MSLFGAGWNAAVSTFPLDAEKVALAEKEAAYLQSLQESILNGCQQKCFVKHYAENELSKGELCCVDRCVSKFFRASLLINQNLNDLGATPEYLASLTPKQPFIEEAIDTGS